MLEVAFDTLDAEGVLAGERDWLDHELVADAAVCLGPVILVVHICAFFLCFLLG